VCVCVCVCVYAARYYLARRASARTHRLRCVSAAAACVMMLLRVPLPMCVCGNVQCATPERVEAGASPLLAQLRGLGYAPPRCMKSPGGPPWSMWLPLTGNICINAFIQLFAFAPRLHAFDTFSLLVAVLCARANSCVCVCVCVSVWGSECALFSLARGRFHGGQVTVSGQFSTG
jgi:hypothetical protein